MSLVGSRFRQVQASRSTASPLSVVRARVSGMQQTAYQSRSSELADQAIEIMRKLYEIPLRTAYIKSVKSQKSKGVNPFTFERFREEKLTFIVMAILFGYLCFHSTGTSKFQCSAATDARSYCRNTCHCTLLTRNPLAYAGRILRLYAPQSTPHNSELSSQMSDWSQRSSRI